MKCLQVLCSEYIIDREICQDDLTEPNKKLINNLKNYNQYNFYEELFKKDLVFPFEFYEKQYKLPYNIITIVCKNGDIDIITYFLKKYNKYPPIDCINFFLDLERYNKFNTFKHFYQLNKNINSNLIIDSQYYHLVIVNSIRHHRINFVKYIIEELQYPWNNNQQDSLYFKLLIAQYGALNIALYFINNFEDEFNQYHKNNMANIAIYCKQYKFAKYFYKTYNCSVCFDNHTTIKNAVKYNKIKFFKYCYDKCNCIEWSPDKKKLIKEIIYIAVENSNFEVIKYVLKPGDKYDVTINHVRIAEMKGQYEIAKYINDIYGLPKLFFEK